MSTNRVTFLNIFGVITGLSSVIFAFEVSNSIFVVNLGVFCVGCVKYFLWGSATLAAPTATLAAPTAILAAPLRARL